MRSLRNISTVFLAALLTLTPTRAQQSALDLNGAPADPLHAAPGKIVVLVFIRTDCPVSNRYAPLIQRLSTQHADKVAFFLVYPEKSTTADAIRKHEHDFSYTVAALRDPQHMLVKQSQVQITPEAAVFDANHRLIYHGRIDDKFVDFGHARPAPTTHELDDAIRAALNGTAPPPHAPAVGCYISDLE
jgi:hypothetical protein